MYENILPSPIGAAGEQMKFLPHFFHFLLKLKMWPRICTISKMHGLCNYEPFCKQISTPGIIMNRIHKCTHIWSRKLYFKKRSRINNFCGRQPQRFLEQAGKKNTQIDPPLLQYSKIKHTRCREIWETKTVFPSCSAWRF